MFRKYEGIIRLLDYASEEQVTGIYLCLLHMVGRISRRRDCGTRIIKHMGANE